MLNAASCPSWFRCTSSCSLRAVSVVSSRRRFAKGTSTVVSMYWSSGTPTVLGAFWITSTCRCITTRMSVVFCSRSSLVAAKVFRSSRLSSAAELTEHRDQRFPLRLHCNSASSWKSASPRSLSLTFGITVFLTFWVAVSALSGWMTFRVFLHQILQSTLFREFRLVLLWVTSDLRSFLLWSLCESPRCPSARWNYGSCTPQFPRWSRSSEWSWTLRQASAHVAPAGHLHLLLDASGLAGCSSP